jgi:sugar phosphate permease
MGIASLVATDKFHTTAEQLSLLAVAQLVVYAAMQIPVGLLLDRFGPRVLLAIGALSMALGQYTVAFAPQLGVAVLGRMLVGFGDAFTFISMIRLINGWYTGKRASQLQQLLGNGGQVGQIISAVPFAYLLHVAGWVRAFSVWATIALILAVAVWFLVQDDPSLSGNAKPNLAERISQLRDSIKLPSTKMAFWVHFTALSPSTVIALLWGVPFLEQSEGLSKLVVTTIFGSFVVIGIIFGTVFGQLCAHRPAWRRPALTLTTSLMLASWLLLILIPGPAPLPVIALWVLFTSMNAPASMVAFDYTREYVPKQQLGSANGFVNIGGFVATFSMMFIVGVVLDIYYETSGKANGLPLYSLTGFRFAFISVILVVGSGLFQYLINEKRTRISS